MSFKSRVLRQTSHGKGQVNTDEFRFLVAEVVAYMSIPTITDTLLPKYTPRKSQEMSVGAKVIRKSSTLSHKWWSHL